MKRMILCVFIIIILVIAIACQMETTENIADVEKVLPTDENGQASGISDIDVTTSVDIVKRFFECFNTRDSESLNILMIQGHNLELTQEESATLLLLSCEQLPSDNDEKAVVQVRFYAEIDEREQTSFEEGEYAWQFELQKDAKGHWCITDYGM